MMRRMYAFVIATTLFAFAGAGLSQETSAPIKVACVGDSITFGAGIKDRATGNFPAQLGKMLGEGYEVRNFGVSGATLLKKGNKPYWNLKAFKDAQEFQPDIVIVKLGTNDSKPGNWQHKAEFVSDYIEMIETFRALESKPTVWICYPIPVFADRWGINDKTVKGEIVPLVEEIAGKTGVHLIDLYAALLGKEELVPDKVHPNAEGARLIAETITAALSDAKP